jgi:hypothetical protein
VTAFDPEALLSVLVRHGVRFVVVGGFAATVHGSPLPTYDVDITPQRDHDNLTRLVGALGELGARIRVEGEPGGLAFSAEANLLMGVSVLNLVTGLGELDLVLLPAGGMTYEGLLAGALHLDLDGLELEIASLADVVRSKAAADRPKDRAALPVLRALLARSAE